MGQRHEQLAAVPLQVHFDGQAGRAPGRHQVRQQRRKLAGERPDQRRRLGRGQAVQGGAQQVHDRGERRGAVLGEAGAGQDAEATSLGVGRRLGDEARLAQASLAGDEGDPSAGIG